MSISHNTNLVLEVNAKDHTHKAFGNINKNLSKTKKQAGAVQQQFRFMRGGMGQLGHQIQDVAVQLQMGQNALLVFGQQGGQIASIFGNHGAVVGAVLAVGAAIATALLPNLFKTSEAMKKAEEGSKDLALKLHELSGASRLLAIAQLEEKIADAEKQMAKASNEVKNLSRDIKFGGAVMKNYVRTEKEVSEATVVLESKIENLKEQLRDLKDVQKGNVDSFKKMNDKLLQEAATIGMSTEALALYEISLMKIPPAQKAILSTLKLSNIARQKEREDQKAIEKQGKSAIELFKRTNKALKTELATFGFSRNAIRAYNIEKSNMSRVNKDANLAILASIHSLEVAEENRKESLKERIKEQEQALEDFKQTYRPIFDELGDGFVDAITGAENFADSIKAMAKSVVDSLLRIAVQKLLIDRLFGAFTKSAFPSGDQGGIGDISTLSQRGGINNLGNLLSFDGGGFTGNGARSAGLDGKGGFMAMLHPKETVIDHTKGQSSGGTTVVQHITVNAGVSSTVRAEMMNLLPSFAQAAKNGVADAKLRGGQYAKALA